MAMDMFIKIHEIDGESQDETHGKSIDVLAWSWGASNSGNAHVGGGQGAGKVNVQDISFTKYIDKSSPKLMALVHNGKHIEEATLTVRKAGETPLEYLKITMNDLIVTSLSTGGSGGEDRLTENITLNFAKVKVEYNEQDKTGKVAAGSPILFGWDIQKNVKM